MTNNLLLFVDTSINETTKYIDIACFYLNYSMHIGAKFYPFIMAAGLLRMIITSV
jgi:hypothetical protein